MRRGNDLYVGNLTMEGRTVKHPARISYFNTPNVNKIDDHPITLIGLDIETNYETGKMELLGIHDGKHYRNYRKGFLDEIFSLFRFCSKVNGKIGGERVGDFKAPMAVCYWSRLDPFQIYKQFLLLLDPEKQIRSMYRFGRISAKWDSKNACWDVKPVCEVVMYDRVHFGIADNIRSSIKFFIYREGDPEPFYVWAYDIRLQYLNGLEYEAKLRLPYYSKLNPENGGDNPHLLDAQGWERYDRDPEFRKLVDLSNELDSHACLDLGGMAQEEFFEAHGYYQTSLVSAGAGARSASVAIITNEHKKDHPNDAETVAKLVKDDINSIAMVTFQDEWLNQLGDEKCKDLLCMISENYSGARIEATRYGYTPTAWIADITQAYPAVISNLWDLRGAKITYGTGEPPHIPNSYVVIRGTVHVPESFIYHPISIKHPDPLLKDTNICAVGEYRCGYSLTIRDFMVERGARFEDEEWFNIETTGKLSPIAIVARRLTQLRGELLAKKSTSQFRVKQQSASLYGIEYEATEVFEEIGNEVENIGYRGGEFYNPLYAGIITGETRILLSRVCDTIEKRGGKVILQMTDSVLWKGTFEQFPAEYFKDKKTVGFFEKPKEVKNVVCLGSGRYSYEDDDGDYVGKTRGLNIAEIHDPNGIIDESGFKWIDALRVMEKTKADKIHVKVRVLVSVGMILHSNTYKVEDLGRVVEEWRDVDVIVGKNKRFYGDELKNPSILAKRLVNTKPIYIDRYMYGGVEIPDQTYPELRAELMKKSLKTQKKKNQESNAQSQQAYYRKNKDKVNSSANKRNNPVQMEKYRQLGGYGYDAPTKKKMSHWSMEKIMDQLKKDGKI